MSFKKSLVAGSFMGMAAVGAAACGGCGSSVDSDLFGDGHTTLPDGGMDAMVDSAVDGDAAADGSKDSGMAGDASSEDGGKNCDQITVALNGPASMHIEQGVFGVKLICLNITTDCHDQVLKALKFQTTGTLTAKDYSSTYSLRDSFDTLIGGFKNPSITGEIDFNGITDPLVAKTANGLCVFADISMSAPVGSTTGLKVPKGGVLLADSKTAIVPDVDINGNQHLIVAKK